MEELYQGLKPSGNYIISDMLQRATAPQREQPQQQNELQAQNQLQNRRQTIDRSQSEPTVNNPAPVAGS